MSDIIPDIVALFFRLFKVSNSPTTKEQKAKVSHRALALNEVLNWLKNEYNDGKN